MLKLINKGKEWCTKIGFRGKIPKNSLDILPERVKIQPGLEIIRAALYMANHNGTAPDNVAALVYANLLASGSYGVKTYYFDCTTTTRNFAPKAAGNSFLRRMPLITLFIILIGLAVGSFLNVCIFRIPKGQSVVLPVSSCRVCGARLHFLDIIPLVSYLLLRGRCRYCRAEFSPRYAVVEALTAGLFVLCYEVFGLSALCVKAFVFVSFLIIITFIDLDHQLIFDKVLLWFAPLGVILNLLFSGPGIIDIFIAALAGGGLLLVIAVVSRGGMGGGDVKFVAALGLWLGVKLLIVCLLLTFIIGGLGGAALLALKLKGRKDAIPFGPFIAVGALLSMLYGQKLIFWYLGQLY